MLGYLSHLVLDEIWSIRYIMAGRVLKNSFGTALKLFGRELVAEHLGVRQAGDPDVPGDQRPQLDAAVLRSAPQSARAAGREQVNGYGVVSIHSVTGPSLTSSTCMCGRKRPLATSIPWAATASMKTW